MPRKIVLFLLISVCFVLQTTMFHTLSFANIGPNLIIIVVTAFGEAGIIDNFKSKVLEVYEGAEVSVEKSLVE